MQYVPPIGGAANDPYVDANPAGGTEGSAVPAAAIEHPMRELTALIADAGLAGTSADLTQVAKAIKTLFQKAGAISAAASGTVDAITANFVPAVAALTEHLLLIVRASGANTSPTPTFTPASATIPAKTIVKGHNQPLVAGDISGAGFRAELQYDLALDKWMLLNPATGVSAVTIPDASTTVKGKVQLATSAEAQALTDALKSISPATLAAAMQGSNQSLATSGYQKLPGGLIVQWGKTGVLTDDATTTITFPIAFPNSCLNVTATCSYAAFVSSGHIMVISSVSTTNFGLLADDVSTTTNASLTAYWLAIGY